ncbi:Uncharacterised protein [Candidatus Bilamarchaeum dharawalense]|uniref:Peptidase family M50 n=1 Tax=Candidatus Bilamarchaeum dharawalense TaxID=2885759 RepID=A0A5E4LTY9_9ARCH|nr:Uncharacterised protein [Candidatus Bilamarchaeum dharawalense]
MNNRLVFFLLIMQLVVFAAANSSDPGMLFLKISTQMDANITNQADTELFFQQNSVIVVGEDASLGEKLIIQATKVQNPWLNNVKEVRETNFTDDSYKLIILVGGPSQNNLTNYVKNNGYLNESFQFEGGITVETGKWGNATVVTISDKQGYEIASKRESTSYSPLNGIIPKEYIPVAATGISVIILALINVVKTVFEFKALDFGRKGKKVGQGSIFIWKINISEIIAIIGASIVLGISISWQYFGPSPDFLKWLVINSIICLAGAILHEVTHKIMAILFKIKIEYKFWPAGSALTLLSSYLGNAFSIQAFLLEEIDPKTAKWKVGLMKLAAPVVSAVVMVVFAGIYFFDPSPIYRVVYSTSALWAMAEMLPFSGLDGKDIKEWNGFVWFVAFSAIGLAYVVITFLL